MKKLSRNQKILMATGVAFLIFGPMKTSFAEAFIMKKEGLRLKAYKDTGGKWTIGYGSTFHYDLNRPVREGDEINMEQARRFLKMYNDAARQDILKSVKVPLTENQLDALSSFYYNFGATKFKGSTLFKLLNQGVDKKIVAKEFDKWIYGINDKTGKFEVLPGLVTRRKAEKELFLK